MKELSYQTITSNISFRKLIENSHEGISLLDKELKVIYRSRSAGRINGWSDLERSKILFSELIHPDDTEMVSQTLRQVLNKPGIPFSIIFRGKHFKGYVIWLECTFTNYLNDDCVNAIVCNFNDITERKLAEEKLQENAAFISNIADNVPALIAYWSADLRCLYANKPHLEWFGKQLHEMQGISKMELLGPAEFEMHSSHISDVLKGLPQSFERVFDNHKGQKIWTHTQYLPDWQGNIIKGFYSLVTDITKVNQADQLITKKDEEIDLFNNRLSLLAKASNEAIFELNLERQEIWWSESHFKMFGFDPLLPVPAKEVWLKKIHPDSRPIFDQIEKDVLESRLDNWEYEIKYLKDDNSVGILLSRGFVVKNAQQQPIRLIGSFLDITKRKNYDQQKLLNADINSIFNRDISLDDSLQEVLKVLADFGGFCMAEAWLIGPEKKQINLAAKYPATAIMQNFYRESAAIKSFNKGDGMPGTVWKNETVEVWHNVGTHEKFVRRIAAENAGLQTLYGIPLQTNDETIGVLLLGQNSNALQDFKLTNLFSNLTKLFGPEIKRKQLEQELTQIFNLAPDILCISGIDGYFKKINPAMSRLLEYPEAVLLSKPFLEFVHPDDIHNTKSQLTQIADGSKTSYLENRYITGSGKVKWLGWTTTAATEDHLTFCVAKDITEKKELEQLLDKSSKLAKIGAWEVDARSGEITWSAMAREIFEVPASFTPTVENILPFFKLEDQAMLIQKSREAIEQTAAFDTEIQITTAIGNPKWLRVLGSAEVAAAGYLRLYGSYQDIDARKTAEINAKKTLEESNTILDSIDDAFFVIDKNWTVTRWNTMAGKFFQKPKSEILNRSILTEFPTWVGSLAHEKYEQALLTGNAVHFEHQGIGVAADKWLETSIYPTGNGLKAYVKDITVRKNAVIAEMNALEERNVILESIDDAFFAVDKNWVVTYWNKSAERLFERPKSTIIGESLVAAYPNWVGTEAYYKYEEVARTKTAAHFEYKTLNFEKWMEISVYPTENGLSVYVKDITARKDAELLAASALDEKNLILESISDAFFAVDKNWIVSYWNKAAEMLYNIPKDRILNTSLLATFPTLTGSDVYDKYNAAMCGNVMHFEYKAILIDRWLAASVSPTENGFTAYVTDISERKDAEAQLTSLNQSLQAQTRALAISNAELEQFAYVASHDLQEPLRMVTSFLTLIEKKYGTILDDKGKQYINFAVDGAKRMRQIILDLLEFSRLHNFDDCLEEVNLNKITDEVLALYRKTIEDSKASVKVAKLPTLVVYRSPLRQVFQNLISNSLKYHKPDVAPLITVSCEERTTDWLFCVHDNGIGIENEYFDKIFIIFQRLHNQGQYSGTGMGLAITKKIIENMGGKLWVDSKPGIGSSFYFTIPKN